VIQAADGLQALAAMQQQKPDLVLLDLKMPVMDGPATLKEIRAQWKRLPVIILTGYPDSDLMSRALESSPVTLLAKPVEPDHIMTAVRDALAVRWGADWTHPKASIAAVSAEGEKCA